MHVDFLIGTVILEKDIFEKYHSMVNILLLTLQ